jgi:hypothetical protein
LESPLDWHWSVDPVSRFKVVRPGFCGSTAQQKKAGVAAGFDVLS